MAEDILESDAVTVASDKKEKVIARKPEVSAKEQEWIASEQNETANEKREMQVQTKVHLTSEIHQLKRALPEIHPTSTI